MFCCYWLRRRVLWACFEKSCAEINQENDLIERQKFSLGDLLLSPCWNYSCWRDTHTLTPVLGWCVFVCVCAWGSVLSCLSSQKDDIWESEWAGPVYQGGRARAGCEEIQRYDTVTLLSPYTLSYFYLLSPCHESHEYKSHLLPIAHSALKYLATFPLL